MKRLISALAALAAGTALAVVPAEPAHAILNRARMTSTSYGYATVWPGSATCGTSTSGGYVLTPGTYWNNIGSYRTPYYSKRRTVSPYVGAWTAMVPPNRCIAINTGTPDITEIHTYNPL